MELSVSDNPLFCTTSLTKPRVLIVDDSRSTANYVKELLEQAGYIADSASDGKKGLDHIETHDVDVVLLDIEMPGMSGLEVLDKLNSRRRLYSVILFTALSGVGQRAYGLNTGADDYISKPFEPGELIARVNAAVRNANLKKDLAQANDAVMDAYQKLNEAQGRLIEKQRLQAFAKMSAGVAHELNNPLGFIRSNLNTLVNYANVLSEGADRTAGIAEIFNSGNLADLQGAFGEFNQWARKARLEHIRQDIQPMIAETLEGIDRTTSFIRCMLIMDQAGLSMQSRPEDLCPFLKSMLERFSMGLPDSVSFASEIPEGPLTVHCNIGQMNIAVENLLINAADAVGKDGSIIVRAFNSNGWICISIEDTGEGIPAENVNSIFDPFFTTRCSIRKIGLGLTVSQTIIHAHGGKIEIRSNTGKGIKATICLPSEEMALRDL